MNLYSIEASGKYCGGVAIVAADSQEEAVKLAAPLRNATFAVNYASPDCIEILKAVIDGPARVLTHYEMGE